MAENRESPPDPPAGAARRSRLGGISLALVLAVGAGWILLAGEGTPDPLLAGAPAPGFELPVLGSTRPVSLESLRGRVVLLNFWATWCKPCEDEMPAMERLYRDFAPRGLELLAVSVDDRAEPVEVFRDRLGLSFPILLDPKRRVADTYQSYKFPETWLIDARGILVARFIGPREWDAPEYADRVRRLLESPSGGADGL